MVNSKRRLRDALRRDEELENLESIEQRLEDDVRYYWQKTRQYLGHEEWTFYDRIDSDDWCGCNCNRYNRAALLDAIHRLRTWRERREFMV